MNKLETLLFIALLAISGVSATLDPSSKKKDRLQGIYAVLGALALAFVFCKTTIGLFDAPDVKHSTKKWNIVYKNNINADIKLKYNSVTMVPTLISKIQKSKKNSMNILTTILVLQNLLYICLSQQQIRMIP